MTIKLTSSQNTFVRTFPRWFTGDNPIAILQGDGGCGKAQPLDELVLTPEGFIPMATIEVGSLVITEEGLPVEVLETFKQESLEMYELTFSDGSTTRCCKDHLWKVQSKKNRELGNFRVLPLIALLAGINTPRLGKRSYVWSVPLTKPVAFANKELILFPYSMGYTLGNGSSGRNSLIVSIAGEDSCEVLSYFQSKEVLSTHIKADGVFTIALELSHRKYYEGLGLKGVKSVDKFIPMSYLLGSIGQRKELLAGLVDSDGSCVANRATFSSSSSKLVQDFCWLVRSLGGTATANKQNRGLEWNVCFRTPFNPFKLVRKAANYTVRQLDILGMKRIVSARYLGKQEGKCISVASATKLYLTRDFTVTHNTTSLRLALDKVSTLKKSSLILAETNEAVNVLRNSLGANYPNIKTVCSAFNLVVGTDEEGVKGQVQHREPEFEGITLLCLDETSMVSSHRLKMILNLCAEKGIYVLLIGDEDQLPPVDGILLDNDPCISPAFLDDWYLANGFRPPVRFNLVEPCRNTSDIYEFCTAVKKLLKPKAFGLIPAKYLKPSSFLKGYLQTPEGNLAFLNGEAVVLAYTNKRVAELNLLVRKELFGAESEETWLVGDRLIFRQPSKCFNKPVSDNNNYLNNLVSQTGETFTTNTKAVVKGVKYKTVLGLTVVELYIHSTHYKEGKKDGYVILPYDRKEAVAYWTKLDLTARFDHNPDSRKKKYELRDAFCSIFNVGIHGGNVEDARNDTKHSYSLSVHCSQGSSIPVVFVDEANIATVRNRVLKLKLSYVAYSRSVSTLVRLF